MMTGDDERLANLLLSWEESKEQGRVLTPAELAPDDPALAARLAERIAILEKVDRSIDLEEKTRVSDDEPPHPWLAELPSPPSGYEILSEIGRGGMGIVYRARQTRLDRLVALKVILHRDEATRRQRMMFESEARAIARVQHENIVSIYDIQEQEGCLFISMELVEGCDLRAKRQAVDVSPGEARDLVATLARAIHHAHQLKVVHRDLKPANILLAGPADAKVSECVPKITDFGIASVGENSGPASTTVAGRGSPAYMAPEQARADIEWAMKPTVDIHGLGVILYELLTGEPPFSGKDSFEVLKQVVEGPPSRVLTLAPDVPPRLAEICEKCLEKNPMDRFSSARELAEALEDVSLPEDEALTEAEQGRRFFVGLLGTAALGALGYGAYRGLSAWMSDSSFVFGADPIKVGVLLSRRGINQANEMPVGEAIRLAVKEMNKEGGLLGRPLEVVWRDPQSRTEEYVHLAEEMIVRDKVDVILGCFRSSDRRAVVPVIEKHNHLLIYPVVFEGLESTEHVLYTGSLPNQRLIPAIKWCRGFLPANKFFLLGSRSLWSEAMAAIARPELEAIGAEISGIEFIAEEGNDAERVIDEIQKASPDVVFLTLSGTSLVRYVRAGRARDPKYFMTPHLLLVHEMQELRELTFDVPSERFYFSTNYLFNLESPANERFRSLIATELGPHRFASDAMESAYVGLQLWAQAVDALGLLEPPEVRQRLLRSSIEAPSGKLEVDAKFLALWQHSRVGRIIPGQGVEIEYDPKDPLPPVMYPPTRTRAEWEALVKTWRDHPSV